MAQLVLCPECSRHVRQFTAHPRLAPDPRNTGGSGGGVPLYGAAPAN